MVLSKKICKALFDVPQRQALSDLEHRGMREFISGVVIGKEDECLDYSQDVVPFMTEFKPNWAKLYARYKEKKAAGVKEWPFFEGQGYDKFMTGPDKVLFVTYSAVNEHGWAIDTDMEEADLVEWQWRLW
jgi:hypothetical protein